MSTIRMSVAIARRVLRVAATVLAASLVAAGSAHADTASLNVTDAAGTSDPVTGVGRTFTLSGNSPVPRRVFVKYRATGGAACAPSPDTDSGEYFSGLSGYAADGDFVVRTTDIWRSPGTIMFCFWIGADYDSTATPITQNVTFRAPTGTISGTVAPTSPQPEQDFTVTVTGASEAPQEVFAKIRAAGGAQCAISYSSDQGTSLLYGTEVNGAFSLTATTSLENPGAYLLCLWLADSDADSTPIAGPQPATFTVLAPPAAPAPCRVPVLATGTTLNNVVSSLGAARCTLGTRRYVASRRYRRGTLIRLMPAAGTSLAPQSPVAVLLSSGRPCTVPLVRRGMRLRTAKALLTRLGCTVGATRYVNSRRSRGTVVSFSRPSGSRLSPRAVVGVRVSRGRGSSQ